MSDLGRFVVAQHESYGAALAEIRAGRKTSHWIWYVFPQLASLGRSQRAKDYGIAGLEEARAFLAHPILGPRLEEISRALLAHAGERPEDILGSVDAMKVRSSMTLFDAAAEGRGPFREVLAAFYGGARCPLTMAELKRG